MIPRTPTHRRILTSVLFTFGVASCGVEAPHDAGSLREAGAPSIDPDAGTLPVKM